jgi:hypothetical protein
MLEIDVAIDESFDESKNKFVVTRSFTVNLQHSLVTASKWESLWKEPFLGKKDKTAQQTLSYVNIMIINDELPSGVFKKLIDNHLHEIENYIADPMTATKLYNDPNTLPSRETITTELIYYWMISLNIPVQFELWHLNRLITLIRTVNLKNSPKRKMSAKERRDLNKARLAKYNTRG